MNKLMLIAILSSLIFIAGCTQNTKEPILKPDAQSQNVIEITASGFTPAKLTISSGETVTFVNKDSESHWPASAMHPTHALYPESGGCISSKFDACKGLSEGETFSFVFNNKGNWPYHDHLIPSLRGSIEVI